MITGNGILPKLFLDNAHKKGIIVYPLALFDTVDEGIKSHANYQRFNIGQVGSFISFFLKENIKEVIMLGKVDKKEIFKDMDKDDIYELIMSKLPDKKDETLLMAVVAILRMNGIKMLPQNYLLEDSMTENICYTKTKPDDEDIKTIKIGLEAAKRLTEVDASQCVVVKDKSVIALEGIEGTDATIDRASRLVGKGTIIVKVARPRQDMRLDIPVVGMGTVKKAVEVGAKGIVVEAGKMMFLEKEAVTKLADENDIFIIGQKI